MTTRGALVAAEARTWKGTPFKWQQAVKGPGGGCDCKGLVKGVAASLGFPEAQNLYANMAAYSPRKPVPCRLLIEGLSQVFDRVPFVPCTVVPPEIRAGDVLLVKFKGRPQHLLIVTGDGLAVHSQIGPKDWVKEGRLEALLRAYPLHSIFRWRD
jgi:cell wall-associated NlpC family hydrolase